MNATETTISRPLAGFPNAARAQVIFHVARTLRAVGIDSFELGENLHHGFADDIRQHVETSAMRHAHDGFMHVGVGGAIQNLVQDDDGGLRSFQRKTLVSDEARVQEMFELFGFNDALQRAHPGGGVERPAVSGRLHAELQPALLLRNLDVHELASDFSAVGVAQGFEDLAQRGDLLRLVVIRHQRAGEKLAVQIPDRQPVSGRIELGMINGLGAQRIEIGDQMAAHAVGVDELQYRCFLRDFVQLRAAHAGDRDRTVRLPMHGLVRDLEVGENLFVEVVPAFQARACRRPRNMPDSAPWITR